MNLIYDGPLWIIIATILALAIAATEIGFRIGRARVSAEGKRGTPISGMIQGSIIGMIALLLGFSFSIATGRYNDRSRFVVDEANSLLGCYLRAGLLHEPARTRIRDLMRQYLDYRVAFMKYPLHSAGSERADSAMNAATVRLWSEVTHALQSDPAASGPSNIVAAADEVVKTAAIRAWGVRNRLPASVLVLLTLCLVISSALVGYSSAEDGRRHTALWMAMNVIVLLVVFVILDFDRPMRGLIDVDQSPLIRIQQRMQLDQ